MAMDSIKASTDNVGEEQEQGQEPSQASLPKPTSKNNTTVTTLQDLEIQVQSLMELQQIVLTIQTQLIHINTRLEVLEDFQSQQLAQKTKPVSITPYVSSSTKVQHQVIDPITSNHNKQHQSPSTELILITRKSRATTPPRTTTTTRTRRSPSSSPEQLRIIKHVSLPQQVHQDQEEEEEEEQLQVKPQVEFFMEEEEVEEMNIFGQEEPPQWQSQPRRNKTNNNVEIIVQEQSEYLSREEIMMINNQVDQEEEGDQEKVEEVVEDDSAYDYDSDIQVIEDVVVVAQTQQQKQLKDLADNNRRRRLEPAKSSNPKQSAMVAKMCELGKKRRYKTPTTSDDEDYAPPGSYIPVKGKNRRNKNVVRKVQPVVQIEEEDVEEESKYLFTDDLGNPCYSSFSTDSGTLEFTCPFPGCCTVASSGPAIKIHYNSVHISTLSSYYVSDT